MATRRHARGVRGRPPHALRAEDRRMMRIALRLTGGVTAVAALQAWCPRASRRAITTWLRRERRAARRRLHVVRWTTVGRVWAVDISQPPRPIDRAYRYLVHVRDLASQYHLAALPVRRATARAIGDLLRAVCATADPPLVVKVDNGSPFVSRALTAWAMAVQTRVLYSPPAWPQYNGSIEASIGSITTRSHHLAAADGHPGDWTTDDVERARTAANLTAPARPPRRRTAADAWQARTPITRRERRRFLHHYAQQLATRRSRATRAQCRLAIVRALDVLGYVSITRRADFVH
jgi:hypothetical protein